MAGNVEVQIKPNGLSQRNLVDVLYMIVAAIHGICAKLDADGGVTLETYEDNCFKAIFNGYIENSRGSSVMNMPTAMSPPRNQEAQFMIAKPTGIDDKALLGFLYQIFDMMETLTEQCDTDNLGDSNYEALVYTAHYTWMVTNSKGNTLGNGNEYWFNPGGCTDQKQLIDLLAMIVHSMDVFTKKLDADGTVTDTTYHALWDTAIFLLKIEDSKGNAYGNALTTFMP
jgi:hypothetical protein